MSRRPERMNCPNYPQSDDDFWMDDDDMLTNINAARMQGVCVDDLQPKDPMLHKNVEEILKQQEQEDVRN